MAANKMNFHSTSVGRLVSGSLTEKRDRDIDGRPIAEDDRRYEQGIAFPKTDPWIAQFFGEMQAFMGAEWANQPQKAQALGNWFQTMNGLSMKIADGDRPGKNSGKVNENTAGHYVLYFSGSYQPKTVDPHNNEIPPEAIKRGYYVQIAGNLCDNEQPFSPDARNRAGIYMNPSVIRLVAEGDVIVGGIDAETAFGGTQAPVGQLPAGARPLGTNVGMPGMATTPQGGALPGQQVQQTVQQPMPGQQVQQTVQQQQYVQPQVGNVQQAAQGQMPGANAPMPGQGQTVQGTALPGTASHSNIQPHTGILAGPTGALPGMG